jgi:hypothetical protein
MMVRKCMSTRYVLFWIVVVPTIDPKDPCHGTCTHVYHAITRPIWVGLGGNMLFSSFVDIRGRRTGCDFLDFGDGVGLSTRLGTRGGLYMMRLPQW